DKKEKERADKLNKADAMIFQTEKQLKDLGDKLPADKKSSIESALATLKEAHKNQNLDAIDSAIKGLEDVLHAASQDMYNAANAQGGAQGGNPFNGQNGGQSSSSSSSSSNNGDNVQDADFEEVK
ncbi:MAG: Hsp70 family protein, partial [Paludibacteraceae bacterium]|nr:Hsp70 family protein [Paludibacteraceae bacterium]